MEKTNSYSKAYECIKCGKEEEHKTNHWGNIYNIHCSVCNTLTEWKVSEEIPEGAWVPEPWTSRVDRWSSHMPDDLDRN